MFHTGIDCAACQPLLFLTVKIEESKEVILQER